MLCTNSQYSRSRDSYYESANTLSYSVHVAEKSLAIEINVRIYMVCFLFDNYSSHCVPRKTNNVL